MKYAHLIAFRISHLAFCFSAIAADAAFAAPPSPYGVCAHMPRIKDPVERAEEAKRIATAGIGRVRWDLGWCDVQKEKGADFDFSHFDAVVADAEAQGLTVLPILCWPPQWAGPFPGNLEGWRRFVEAVVSHYGDRFPDIEVMNEVNLGVAADEYIGYLKTAYEAAKRTNPRVRVLFSGTAGADYDYYDRVCALGGAKYFDAANVHPYEWPRPPEGDLGPELERMRAMLAKHGVADKPIVITEHGWPTHDARVGGLNILRAGLAVARPGQKAWRTVYAAAEAGSGGKPPHALAEAIEEGLPPGSTCEACFGERLRERLAAGDVDLVIYPFDEGFPVDTFDDVRAFVERGGVLADLGGMPMWYAVRETSPGEFSMVKDIEGGSTAKYRQALCIAPLWPNKDGRAFPTPAAVAAGFKGDPAGERIYRWQSPRLLREGDEFIPLLTLNDAKGEKAVAASVTRFAAGTNGCVIIGGNYPQQNAVSIDEAAQARYLARSMAIAFAEGVEQYFWYEFRSPEKDPFFSEHHFGLTHSNFTPKPAWGAYLNFTLARPAGSVQTPGPWHNEKRDFFFPQWTRPDGVKAGVLWTTGPAQKRALRFASSGGRPAEVTFRDRSGRLRKPVSMAPGGYLVPVSGDLIYFEGGELVGGCAENGRR